MIFEPDNRRNGETRSKRANVRNPVLALPATRALGAIDSNIRGILAFLLLDLQRDARERARLNWVRHKAFMAAYWSAIATYSGHIARALDGGGGRDRHLRLLVRQPGFPDMMARDWADASRRYCERRDESSLGASRFPEAQLVLGDIVIARISYNGRIWLPGAWQPGDDPLYGGRAGDRSYR